MKTSCIPKAISGQTYKGHKKGDLVRFNHSDPSHSNCMTVEEDNGGDLVRVTSNWTKRTFDVLRVTIEPRISA